jgi:hypothetical protein
VLQTRQGVGVNMSKRQVSFRIPESDIKVLELAARLQGRSVSSLVQWITRLYAMAVIVDSYDELKTETREIATDRIGALGAEELRVRIKSDVGILGRLVEALDYGVPRVVIPETIEHNA